MVLSTLENKYIMVQPFRDRREGEFEILLRSVSTPPPQMWVAKTTVVSGYQGVVTILG